MAQAQHLTTTTPRALAYADAARASGGQRLTGVPCLTRAASRWANESHLESADLRGLGLSCARIGGGW